MAKTILFEVSTELRALAYLFETQGAQANQIPATDVDQISHALGRMIKRQALHLRRAHSALEKL